MNLQNLNLTSLTYNFDYPAELWVKHPNPDVRAIAELRRHSLELDDMLTNSLNYTWTTHWPAGQNLVRLIIYIEFIPENLTWLLLKYPNGKRVIDI
jgi:hypothetical protein